MSRTGKTIFNGLRRIPKWVKYKLVSPRKKERQIMYIDPNTGGMLFQVLAAAFVAVSGTLLIFGSKIRQGIASLRRRIRRDKDEDSE
jgi:hypothetical protein